MRKRERENPCRVCGHYHKYEEGEVCGICGHRMPAAPDHSAVVHVSAFPSEILPEFLYLGSYDNASRSELLKTQNISRILNTVPSCQNLYKNSFTYHCLQDDRSLQFDDANQFLEQSEKDGARVLVYCMTGKSRSPAVVIAYLMKNKGWKLAQSYQWVKERRPSVELAPGIYEQLQEYEKVIFGSNENSSSVMPVSQASFSFGFPSSNDPTPVPAFNNQNSPSIFAQPAADVPPCEFTFGAGNPSSNQNANDVSMGIYEQLQEYEKVIFGSNENSSSVMPVSQASFSFGFPSSNDPTPVPAFNNQNSPSIFAQPAADVPPREFTFGAGNPSSNQNANDVSMGGS